MSIERKVPRQLLVLLNLGLHVAPGKVLICRHSGQDPSGAVHPPNLPTSLNTSHLASLASH